MTSEEAREWLTALWLDHMPAVESFARRRCPGAAVDDVVQQVFLVAWGRPEAVPDQPRAWLLTVARNVILNQNRAGRRRDALAVRVATVPTPTGSVEDEGIQRASLQTAWAALTEVEREALSLIAWDHLSTTEAAHVLGLTRPAFGMRLARARRHLHDLLGDTTAPPERGAPARKGHSGAHT